MDVFTTIGIIYVIFATLFSTFMLGRHFLNLAAVWLKDNTVVVRETRTKKL